MKNVAASVRQRLANLSRETRRPFAELLQYYAIERLLYRLGLSKHGDRFILKGALLFVAWGTPRSRATKDIDLLARADNSVDGLAAVFMDLCRIEDTADGLVFDPKTVRAEIIKAGAEYAGVRVLFEARLERARVHMQVDVGFGDSVIPAPAAIDYPVLLGMPAPRLKGYPPETVVAEKFEAAVNLGIINTRMKDFYDLWLLSHRFDFEGPTLAAAVRATFARRGAAVTAAPTAFTSVFYGDVQKQTQWKAFLTRTDLPGAPKTLKGAVLAAKKLLVPVVESCAAGRPFPMRWKAPGPWRSL